MIEERSSGMSAFTSDLTRLRPLSHDRSCAPEKSAQLEADVVALFDQHRHRLLVYIMAFGTAPHDAEEIVQEVFLSLFHHLKAGKPRDTLVGWIFRVAHNLALKRRHANQRWQSWMWPEDHEGLQQFRDPSPNPEEMAVSAQRRENLLAVLSALPEQDRLCFTLRAEGLRYREIAAALGISLGSVSVSLTRSLARLTCVADR